MKIENYKDVIHYLEIVGQKADEYYKRNFNAFSWPTRNDVEDFGQKIIEGERDE